MSNGLFVRDDRAWTYRTSAANILKAFKFFRDPKNRFGLIPTGMWDDPVWGRYQFEAWFRKCLNEKINSHLPKTMTTGRKHRDDWQRLMYWDGRHINAYYGQRERHSGCRMLLRLPEMQAKYPHINNQPWED